MSDSETTIDSDLLGRLFRLTSGNETSSQAAQSLSRGAVEEFYRMATAHQDLAPRFEGHDIARLKRGQVKHWESLFASAATGDMSEVLASSERIGHIHVDADVDTTSYLAGYAALTEDLVVGLMKSSLKAGKREEAMRVILRCCFADIAASIAAYASTSSERDARGRLMAMSDSLEREMSTTLSEVRHQVETLSHVAGQLEKIAADVNSATDSVVASAESTREGVNIVASASQELEASSQEISDQTGRAAGQAEGALGSVEDAKTAMGSLTESAAAIGGVTELVQSIAKQTRLLALNATIEAARAGDAGKGFAVVAGEVKSLAAETEKAIASVQERTDQISASTDSVNGALGNIVTGVEELTQRTGSIASAADEQRAAIAEIARSAERASTETGQVADQIGSVQETAQISTRAADRLLDIANRLGRDIGDLQRRITTMLRSSTAGDRRTAECVAVGLEGVLTAGTQRQQGHVVDISESGGLFFPGLDERATGQEGTVAIDGLGHFNIRVVGSSPLGAHLQFLRTTDKGLSQIQGVIQTAKQSDAPLIDLCRTTAKKVSDAFESAINSGRIGMDAMFDDDYVPIDGTQPQQFMTGFVELTDAVLPPIQDAVLPMHRAIVFCAAVDRNAFLPTHNAQYSKPQKPGDVVWNTANCRNRRIFDDRAGRSRPSTWCNFVDGLRA
jgi:methyl-accepting chemotaxis protein